MTSSGLCETCGKVTSFYTYNEPKGWYCDEHKPQRQAEPRTESRHERRARLARERKTEMKCTCGNPAEPGIHYTHKYCEISSVVAATTPTPKCSHFNERSVCPYCQEYPLPNVGDHDNPTPKAEHVERARKVFEAYSNGPGGIEKFIAQALSQLESETKAKTETETIEKCAKICDEQSRVYHSNMEGADEPDFSRQEFAMGAASYLGKRIRSLKGKV